jgi:ribosome-associated toxin RatA of RatAB toxin-antitoxin module
MMTKRALFLGVAISFLGSLPAAESVPASAPVAMPAPVSVPVSVPASAQVTLTQLDSEDLYYIHGSFETNSAPEDVWRVLSDYQGLQGILSGLRSSKVLERNGDKALVEQIMVGQFLFFHKAVRLVLQIKEDAPWRIDFASADNAPFRHYEGSWEIDRTPQGCRVDYTLDVSRGDMAPQFMERQLFQDNSMALMKELSAEVERRAKASILTAPVYQAHTGINVIPDKSLN